MEVYEKQFLIDFEFCFTHTIHIYLIEACTEFQTFYLYQKLMDFSFFVFFKFAGLGSGLGDNSVSSIYLHQQPNKNSCITFV
jgi:hypothetical protein